MKNNPKNNVQSKQMSAGGSTGMKAVNNAVSSIITIFFLAALVLTGVFNVNGAIEVAFRLLGAVYKASEITIKAVQPEYRTLDEVQRDDQVLPNDRR